MCNCINDHTKLIEESLLNNSHAEAVNYVLIPRTLEASPKVAITVEASLLVRLKNGRSIDKQKQYKLVCEYCPFCGVKYDLEKHEPAKGNNSNFSIGPSAGKSHENR